MRSLRIQFNGRRGAEIDFGASVSDFAATAQNCMVCLGTQLGSDLIFPSKGTTLLRKALTGGLMNQRSAEHEANFAGLDILHFVRANDGRVLNDGYERLEEVRVKAEMVNSMPARRASIAASFVSNRGVTIGIISSV